ncbi:MAG: hypothetical protein NTU81_03000 [Candidatus Nomurabacteria bacterium]|nr:hypothetical protein [Candidatus Nomurabacteria bacterium]
MHIINTGKEHVVFTQISEETTILPIDTCEILFKQEVVLSENNQKAHLVIIKKDDPSKLISKIESIAVRPANRAFIRTVDAKFVQAQEILVGFIQDEQVKEITLFPCRVIDIVPNGYLQ